MWFIGVEVEQETRGTVPPKKKSWIRPCEEDIDLKTNLLESNYYQSMLQSTPDNSNLQEKSKKVRVIGSSSYRELEENSRE